MIFEIFIILLLIAVIGLLFSFLYRDNINFIHILIGLLSSILFLILGYNAIIGIDTDSVIGTESYSSGVLTAVTSSVVTKTYQYEWVAMFFIIIGIIGIIYAVINILNEVAEIINQIENNNSNQHESTIITRGQFDD